MFMSIGMFRQVELATVGSCERRAQESGGSSRRRPIFRGL
jgi:hypothetical protein